MNELHPDNRIMEQHDQVTDRRRARIQIVASRRQRGLMVLMEDVHNPHNLAAIARSCDAFGVQIVGATLENHEHFDPQEAGRITSTSASKWLDYRIFDTGTRDALNTLKAEGWHIVATVADTNAPAIYDIDLSQHEKLVLLVGNEHSGLSPTALEMADTHTTIPMAGMIQSFNVSVATAICLYEISRQRHMSGRDYHLPAVEAAQLGADFLERSRKR